MKPLFLFFPLYLKWHYTIALRTFFRVWGNFIWFFYHFFSIPSLARTLFDHWRRLKEEGKSRSLEELAEKLLVNTLMRLVGACVRGLIILIGVGAILMTVIVGSVLFIVWVLYPFVLILLVVYGTLFILGKYDL